MKKYAEELLASIDSSFRPSGQAAAQGKERGQGAQGMGQGGPSGLDADALKRLQAQVAALEAIVKANKDKDATEKEREDLAAIKAIMMGEDDVAHKIQFLVDIPKWQEFKVIQDFIFICP